MIVPYGCTRPAAWCASRSAELDSWIADPKRRIETTVWDAADGAMLHGYSPSSFGPTFAKAADGKLWFVTREDIQVVDPRHLASNKLPPPVHIEQIVADHKMYWQNLPGAAASNLHCRRDPRSEIDYTALSFPQPHRAREGSHFKYKLEGQDPDWREVGQ